MNNGIKISIGQDGASRSISPMLANEERKVIKKA